MATRNTMITSHNLSTLNKPITQSHKHTSSTLVFSTKRFTNSNPLKNPFLSANKGRGSVIGSVAEDREVVPVKNNPSENQESPLLINGSEDFEALSASTVEEKGDGDDKETVTSRAINASIVLGFGTLAVSRLLTIDHDYWHCYEGKPIFNFDRTRMFRSGLTGFALHGPLSHYYYQFCEALFPFEDWWVVPAKVAFDQTVWAALWNSIYFAVLGLLRFESPANILS